MTNAVAFARALADPTRWRIIRLVTDQALCVCELADIMGMPQSSVSSHVQIIRKSGLLESERCEKWTYFRIESRYLGLIRTLAKAFSETADPIEQTDAANAARRMQIRETSCCPGPKALKPRQRSQSTLRS